MVALADSQSDVGVDASFRLTLPYERLIWGDFKTLKTVDLSSNRTSAAKNCHSYSAV